MTPAEIHDQITLERARELERLRYEYHLLRRLLLEGYWPANTSNVIVPCRRPSAPGAPSIARLENSKLRTPNSEPRT